MYHSQISGKKTIVLDGETEFDELELFDSGLDYTFPFLIEGRTITIVVSEGLGDGSVGWQYDLFIDGLSIAELENMRANGVTAANTNTAVAAKSSSSSSSSSDSSSSSSGSDSSSDSGSDSGSGSGSGSDSGSSSGSDSDKKSSSEDSSSDDKSSSDSDSSN